MDLDWTDFRILVRIIVNDWTDGTYRTQLPSRRVTAEVLYLYV